MLNRGKKDIVKRIFFNPKFLSLIGLTVIVFIGFPLAQNAVKQYRINKEIGELRGEIASLEGKSVDLKKFISYLESDQFAEEQARLILNLKKAGEELTVIKPATNGLESASSSTDNLIFDIPGHKKEAPPRELSNPRKWLNYFLK
jgi:cell division protein FtsB